MRWERNFPLNLGSFLALAFCFKRIHSLKTHLTLPSGCAFHTTLIASTTVPTTIHITAVASSQHQNNIYTFI